MTENFPPPPRRAPWNRRQKIYRMLWVTIGRVLWNLLPFCRSSVIRLFGGTVGKGCRFARSAYIHQVFDLTIGDNVQVGERVILYTFGKVTIGDGVIFDFRSQVAAGSHDITTSEFKGLLPPITVGAGTFVGLDAYIGGDVTLGANCTVLPRASVHKSFPDGTVLAGNPARPVDAGEAQKIAGLSG